MSTQNTTSESEPVHWKQCLIKSKCFLPIYLDDQYIEFATIKGRLLFLRFLASVGNIVEVSESHPIDETCPAYYCDDLSDFEGAVAAEILEVRAAHICPGCGDDSDIETIAVFLLDHPKQGEARLVDEMSEHSYRRLMAKPDEAEKYIELRYDKAAKSKIKSTNTCRTRRTN
jgi:hypothetical protein